jgi:hypothetical protein
MELVKADIVNINTKLYTFNIILSFQDGTKARLVCVEDNDGEHIAEKIHVINERCPCCSQFTCLNLPKLKDQLFAQAKEKLGFKLLLIF